MKELAIAAALLAGCASITAPASERGTKVAQIAVKSQEIAARERECKDRAEKQAHGELARNEAGAEAAGDSGVRLASERIKRQIAMCEADAQRANDELSVEESAEYESEEQQARDRAALVRTLLASPVH